MAGLIIVAAWAIAEAILLFIVADVPISALALRHGWRTAGLAALVAAVCAALGGLAVLAWARADPQGCLVALEALPGISTVLVVEAAEAWRSGGWQAMLAGSVSGVPYKLYALAAANDGASPAGFFLASIVARLPRFVLIAAVFSGLGQVLCPRLPAWLIAALFVLGWSLFYVWYFSAMAAR